MRTTHSVRLVAFTAALLLLLGGSLFTLQSAERTRITAQYDADRRLFLRIAEEAENAAGIAARIANNDVSDISDLLALCRACSVITSCAALHSDQNYVKSAAQLYASAQARAEHALAAEQGENAVPMWLYTCMQKASSLLSDSAVLLLASEGYELPIDALPLLEELASLSAAFSSDPLKVFHVENAHIAYRFDAERPHTDREIREDLEFALKDTSDLFVSLDMPTAEESIRNDARCIFSCKNGFAELSLRGGHLLHYALYPTQGISSDGANTRLSGIDLEERRDAFLARNGMPVRLLRLHAQREEHGLCYYTYTRRGEKTPCVTIGLRSTDGNVFYFDGELFYHR